MTRSNRRSQSSGQGLVEIAFVLPVFLFLLMILFDFGRVVYAQHTITEDAREATRVGSVEPALTLVKYQAIRDAAKRMSPGVGLTDVQVLGAPVPVGVGKKCSDWQTGAPDDPINANTCFYPSGVAKDNINRRVEVNISITVPIITPIISQVIGGSVALTVHDTSYIPVYAPAAPP